MIPAILATLLPVLLDKAPEIGKLLGGDRTGEIAGQVADVVTAVLGDNPDAALANSEKLTELRLALARIQADIDDKRDQARLETLKIELADTANARAQTIELVKHKSPMAYGAAIISVLVIIAFGYVTNLVLTQSIPAGSETVATYMLGALQTMATAVVGYWVGSSAGSAVKDNRLANIENPRPLVNQTRQLTTEELNQRSLEAARRR